MRIWIHCVVQELSHPLGIVNPVGKLALDSHRLEATGDLDFLCAIILFSQGYLGSGARKAAVECVRQQVEGSGLGTQGPLEICKDISDSLKTRQQSVLLLVPEPSLYLLVG